MKEEMHFPCSVISWKNVVTKPKYFAHNEQLDISWKLSSAITKHSSLSAKENQFPLCSWICLLKGMNRPRGSGSGIFEVWRLGWRLGMEGGSIFKRHHWLVFAADAAARCVHSFNPVIVRWWWFCKKIRSKGLTAGTGFVCKICQRLSHILAAFVKYTFTMLILKLQILDH